MPSTSLLAFAQWLPPVAIKHAYQNGIDEYHGIKVYFDLDPDQRFDVQLISNLNINVSLDLIDRMYETLSGPHLRDWCQNVGFLDKGQDFVSKRQKGKQITVRDARTFILNFYKGKRISHNKFNDTKTIPILPKSGVIEPEWDKLKKDHKDLWTDQNLKKAGKEFALLAQAQRDYFTKPSKKKLGTTDYAEKAFNYAILSSWAFVAGILQKNATRLKRHYDLRKKKNTDPLNAAALSDGRHKSDPQNYRGLGTRNDTKERGRCVELFFAQTVKGEGIKKGIVDLAIKKYHAKTAILEVKEAESKI